TNKWSIWQSSALFVLRLAQDLEPDELALLGAMLEDKGETYLSVVLGKEAVSRGVMLPRSYFPVHPLAQTDLPVSPELALAIARRESEFNFTVGSPVGALGLMQLMPATAREVAEGLGLPYTSAMLTDGWQYNAQLGSAYLAELTQTFGESPVMIAAGYNAGPSRPRSWMAQRGDPRAGAVDIVDWIEHIPFNETRNYVMRVAESLPIYRARLTGQTGLVHFSALLIGAPPFIRPQARPSPAERAAVEAERLADEQRVFAPLTALRPLARPEVEPG
ncbi:MAG: lytic transglycosylase domain-containing protein, partial [Rhodobacteraceae bacterium]|nr:lytic transglycosylase domain-containing protein [Paracoccaceae bacterium]